MTDWSKKNVPELKGQLKRRKLEQTGLKAVLVARLQAAPKLDWADERVQDLRPELRRRELPLTGTKDILVARLKATDGLPVTREGRDAYYEAKKKEQDEIELAKIAPFAFQRLPLELREMIWELSLPGPRVLVWDSSVKGKTKELYFPKEGHAANPAQLSTCHESRRIALKRYKLCFGTTNIYADLAGGDIVYCVGETKLPSWSFPTYTRREVGQHLPSDYVYTHKPISEDIKNDLLNIQHIALSRECWNRYISGYSRNDGRMLRKELRMYEGLKRVTLVGYVNLRTDENFEGHYEIEDPLFEKRAGGSDAKGNQKHEALSSAALWNEWAQRHPELKGHASASTVLRSFELGSIYEHPKPPEQPKASDPKANFVQIKTVLDSPLRAKERKVKYIWKDEEDGEPVIVGKIPHGQFGRMKGYQKGVHLFRRR
jgi:hypothetical protein